MPSTCSTKCYSNPPAARLPPSTSSGGSYALGISRPTTMPSRPSEPAPSTPSRPPAGNSTSSPSSPPCALTPSSSPASSTCTPNAAPSGSPLGLHGHHVLRAAMVTGLARRGRAHQALEVFRSMAARGVAPNCFVLPSVLASCAALRAPRLGAQAHALAARTGLARDPYVFSALVHMYTRCGDPVTAGKLMDDVTAASNVVAWNSLLAGLARSGREDDAVSLFAKMHRRGLELDEFTYSSAVTCMGLCGLQETGRSVHALAVKAGLADARLHVGNALIGMYAKCARLDASRGVFDGMPQRDIVSWTSLATGYAHCGHHEEALGLFCEMRREGLEVDDFLMAIAVSSCAGLALLELGAQAHALCVHHALNRFTPVGNSIINMYGKCGCAEAAHIVFEGMPIRDVVSWTALVVVYARNARGRDALEVYGRMLEAGTQPDRATFIAVLFACARAGLLKKGRALLESMARQHGIPPGPKHYACMVDLFGRAGRLDEALDLVDQMPGLPDAATWKSLLAASRLHQDIVLAERAAMELRRLAPCDPAPYVALANVYSALRRWDDAARVRAEMRMHAWTKEPGRSWVVVNGKVHVFHAADAAHPRASEVYGKLREATEKAGEKGYVMDGRWEMHEGEGRGLEVHSERLAVAFGLMVLLEGAEVRVFQNLRMCGDCHNWMKAVSEVYGRRIVIRDTNCFHHFGDGVCSCRDYW